MLAILMPCHDDDLMLMLMWSRRALYRVRPISFLGRRCLAKTAKMIKLVVTPVTADGRLSWSLGDQGRRLHSGRTSQDLRLLQLWSCVRIALTARWPCASLRHCVTADQFCVVSTSYSRQCSAGLVDRPYLVLTVDVLNKSSYESTTAHWYPSRACCCTHGSPRYPSRSCTLH